MVFNHLTIGSNRSLRSLGRAKARPLTKRYVLPAMNRILLIILVSLTLTGCPVSINGLIKNKSENIVIIVPPFKTEFSWIIGPGSEEEVSWYQECITVKSDNEIQYFLAWPIPENVLIPGVFSSTLKAVYKNKELFFENNKGEFIKIPQAASCTGT
jgi:hypothetical protein